MPNPYAAEHGMYTVILQKDGETKATFVTHASDEADAQAHCEEFFGNNPEHDPRKGSVDFVFRVKRGVNHDPQD
jgi:hypothetical protein